MAAPKGNKYASEWTLENALPRFEDALKYAETDPECLSLQDAVYYSGIPYTTFYYLTKNHEVLKEIKDNIFQAVIRKINKGALLNDFNATASIWRMKQLGEKDESSLKVDAEATINSTVETIKIVKG